MEYISGLSKDIPPNIKDSLFNYRYRIFVEKLGWDLDSKNDLEVDQFDRDDTYHIVARDTERNIVGCARLLQTTSPYLLGEVFPRLLNGLKPPQSTDIWEISRFTTAGISGCPSNASEHHQSHRMKELLEEAMRLARNNGAKKIISVSTLGIERLLTKEGFPVHRLGPPMKVNGCLVLACYIDL